MSLVDQLLTTRTPLELAKELAATAKDNAALLFRSRRNNVLRQLGVGLLLLAHRAGL